MNKLKLERKLCNASWCLVDEENVEMFLGYTQQSRATVIEKLEKGETVSYGTDWCKELRLTPQPKIMKQPEMVKCSCGHTVPKLLVMSASMGSSCPDCYDSMSD